MLVRCLETLFHFNDLLLSVQYCQPEQIPSPKFVSLQNIFFSISKLLHCE